MNTQRLISNFSRAAENYDKFAVLQRQIGDNLLRRIKKDSLSPRYILDIGTGTARLAQDLSSLYKNARIWGIDFSYGMLEYAKKRTGNLLQADARYLPFRDGSFDLIVSNLTLQWIRGLEQLFQDIRWCLTNRGRFYFSTFGPNTLRELKVAFSRQTGSLPGINELTINLQAAGFKILERELTLEKRPYPDMKSLVVWLKNIGANYALDATPKGLGMRRAWQEAEEIYHSNFRDNGRIFATFEVITVVAIKG